MLFTNMSCRGGAEEHILTLLQGLDRKVFRLYLVCPPALCRLYGGDIPGDVTVIPLLFDKPLQLFAALRFAFLLRRHRIDVLHSHLFCSSMYASPLGWLCRIPLIVETPHVRESWRRGIKRFYSIDRLVTRCIDRLIAVSKSNAEYLIRDKKLPAAKVKTIQNGIDLTRFTARRPAADLRRSLGFDDDALILVAGARLEPQKGHSVLLQAMHRIVKDCPQARLICVGEGSCREELETLASSLGLNQFVRFVGYQPNMPKWLALADITVLSSFFEGLPLIAIEALAAGRPMVATDVDGTAEVVVNGKTGLTVPPGDADALAGAILRLLHDPALRAEFGRAGRCWVEEHFDRQIQISRTEALYLQVLGKEEHTRIPVEGPASAYPRNSL